MEKMVGTRLNPIQAVGLMSGTSLDGIDLAYVHFWEDHGWKFDLQHTHYIPYSEDEKMELVNLMKANSVTLLKAHQSWGRKFGQEIHRWLSVIKRKPHLVASHGHTIFHQPENGFTFQLGDGYSIQKEVKLPVIFDFRSADVAAGGQGAPLVPFGEFHLFPDYEHFLNIGGIANGSSRVGSEMQARDLCFANMWFNHSAKKLGLHFDENGNEARKGVVSQPLFEQLLSYSSSINSSLSAELAKRSIESIDSANISPQDELRTTVEVLLEVFRQKWPIQGQVLVTGGGAKNAFLMQRLNETQSAHFMAAPPQLMDFKEALIFAFLGVLRSQEKVNVFPSVTGAMHPTSGGIFLPY